MTPSTLAENLRAQLALYRGLLHLVEREHLALCQTQSGAQFQFDQLRQESLPALEDALGQLKHARARWRKLPPQERQQAPEIPALLQCSQDVIMKTIVLDRANEQALLRRGLLPASQFPSVHRQRPHFVADLYRRYSSP